MAYKQKGAPYDKDNMNIAVYRKDLHDGSIAKSNHTGIILDKDVTPDQEEAAIAHEKVHQYQQRNGELNYDKENFYWKGKTYPRKNLNEHNEELPWEKEAYKASAAVQNGKNKDMKEKFKLNGYRGNNSAFKTLSDRGLIGASMKDGDKKGKTKTVDKSGTVTKKKYKIDRHGNKIIKEKYKNVKTGEKGGKKTTIKPTEVKYDASLVANALSTISGGGGGEIKPKVKITPPSTDKTPGGETPPGGKVKDPSIKPPSTTPIPPSDGGEKPDPNDGGDVPKAKPGQKQFEGTPDEWMTNISTKWPGVDGKTMAEKGHIHKGRIDEYDKTYYKPKKENIEPMARIEAKPIANLNLKTTDRALVMPKSNLEVTGGIDVEHWRKKKGKKKEKDIPPPKPPKNPPIPEMPSTEFSTACDKGKGLCKSPFSTDTSGMFGTPTRKDKRNINRGLRKVNKLNRQQYREDLSTAREWKRDDRKDARQGGYAKEQRQRERIQNQNRRKSNRLKNKQQRQANWWT